MKDLRFANPKECKKYLALVIANPAAYGITGCVLCSGAIAGIGIFIPTPEAHAKFGGKPGKGRLCFYGFCDDCGNRETFMADVEARMLADLNRKVT